MALEEFLRWTDEDVWAEWIEGEARILSSVSDPSAQIFVCGEPQFRDEQEDVLPNPTVIVEVLSNTTEARDRGEKLPHYVHIPSLHDVLLVSQHEPRIEHYERQPEGRWLWDVVEGRQAKLVIPSIGCTIPLSEVYEGVL